VLDGIRQHDADDVSRRDAERLQVGGGVIDPGVELGLVPAFAEV
jgi:hypothetical protein